VAFRFRNFQVYQDSKNLHKEIAILANSFSRDYWHLADQVRRCSLSVVLNIAGGSSKQSDKDFNRFIAIALGTFDKTVACLEIALDFNLLDKERFTELEKKCESVSKQLGGLSKKLKFCS